mmetsp:Transcript_8355/g.12326  ORF Transcript_8355/g.12326 Transcript_8355/m.12326 type:complete len:216 (-) Transcript_8355:91-738(-)
MYVPIDFTPDPPNCICRESETFLRIKLFTGNAQTDDTLLTGVLKINLCASLLDSLPSDGNYKTKIGFDHGRFGPLRSPYLFLQFWYRNLQFRRPFSKSGRSYEFLFKFMPYTFPLDQKLDLPSKKKFGFLRQQLMLPHALHIFSNSITPCLLNTCQHLGRNSLSRTRIATGGLNDEIWIVGYRRLLLHDHVSLPLGLFRYPGVYLLVREFVGCFF